MQRTWSYYAEYTARREFKETPADELNAFWSRDVELALDLRVSFEKATVSILERILGESGRKVILLHIGAKNLQSPKRVGMVLDRIFTAGSGVIKQAIAKEFRSNIEGEFYG
jgi:hypothetical protein